jgi:hypothetical protein
MIDAMDMLRADICYRPLRLGWAVRRGDLDSLREIFRYSHTLWGGRFNPVIVIDDADRAKRLVELFRVDVVWPLGDGPDVTAFPDRFPHLINPFLFKSLIIGNARQDKRAQLLDIHSTLVWMSAYDEISAMREQGFRIYSWEAHDPLADLFLIQMGTYPDSAEIGIDYKSLVTQVLQPETVALPPVGVLPADIVEHPKISDLPAHRMRRHYTTPASWDYPGFYVGDVGDFDDLVTYWNLRAADIPLWFVDPNHLDRFSDLIPACEKLAQQLLARTPEHDKHVAVWSRSDNRQVALEPFGGRLQLFCCMHDGAWHSGIVSAPMMYFGEAQVLGTISRSGTKPRVSFPLADKPFAADRWLHTQHLVASVSFGIGLYGDDLFTVNPPYVPELNEVVSRAMAFDYSKLRIEPERLGLIIQAGDTDAAISALTVTELFERVFELAGFSARSSNGGLIARQLIVRLSGLQGARVFKIPGVRRLLRTHGPNASFTKKSALQLIGQTDPENPAARFADHERLFIEPRDYSDPLTPAAVFSYLVDKGLFRIGADLTCPVCRLPSWVALDNLQQRSVCALCGTEFDATRQLINERWAYRRSGVLGLEKNNQGAVPVVLTLQQLDANDGMDQRLYSPSLDLTPKDGSLPLEVDFVWMICGDARRRNVVILGECKDRQQDAIDANDVQNLRRVADALPRSRFKTFILLAKLAPFTAQEIALARTLNGERQRRVIMLAARELEPYRLFDRTKDEYPGIMQYATSPEDWALVTAQIYFREAPEPK